MSRKHKSGLGRGLGALLGGDEPDLPGTAAAATPPGPGDETIRELPLNQLQPGRYQPRTRMDEADLQELADSIAEHGIIQPVICTRQGDGYRLVVGERRCRASRMAGLTHVPVIIEEMTESRLLQVALIENLQREDLDPIETALAYSHLLREHDLTQEELAQLVGSSRETVNKALMDFSNRGWIARDGRSIIIFQPGMLIRRSRR